MKIYWSVRSLNSARSVSICSGVKATQFTTASNRWWPSAAAADAGSRMSPRSRVAPSGTGREVVWPRLSKKSWCPASTAKREQAELMMPEPPINRIFTV